MRERVYEMPGSEGPSLETWNTTSDAKKNNWTLGQATFDSFNAPERLAVLKFAQIRRLSKTTTTTDTLSLRRHRVKTVFSNAGRIRKALKA